MENINNLTEEIKTASAESSESVATDEESGEKKITYTEAQEDALDIKGRSVLVSAAAGSGKTFILTKRIIDKLIAGKTLGRMLIVTFTRSAAGKLKSEISEALAKAIEKDPDDPHLHNEVLKLGSANISTIDSFFAGPVKANFEKLGLPASMRAADEAELMPLRESILKNIIGEFYATKGGISRGELTAVGYRSDFTDILSLISKIRDSSGLIPTLIEYYQMTQSLPDGVEVLKKCADDLRASAEMNFGETRVGKEALKLVADEAELTKKDLRAFRDRLAKELRRIETEAINAGEEVPHFVNPMLDKVIADTLDNDIDAFTELLAELEKGGEAACDAITKLKFKNFPSPSKKSPSWGEIADGAREERLDILARIKTLKKNYFSISDEVRKAQFLTMANANEILYELLERFDREYLKEKLRRGIYDFSDMPRFLLKLLRDDSGLTPLALELREKYDEVYIDEYQDVSAIQDEIFAIIGGDHRFMVGDIKQSIYGFRDAEPDIFDSYKEIFPKYDRKDPLTVPPSGGSSIFMSSNFRCDRSVVDFSNEVCDRIFTAYKKSIGYDRDNDLLIFGKTKPHFDPPKKVHFNVIEPAVKQADTEPDIEPVESDEEEDKLYDEAVIMVNEIARLIEDENEVIADKETVIIDGKKTKRPIKLRAGHIAVLVRDKNMIPIITDVMRKVGIKYVTNAKNEQLSSNEMKLLFDILTVIDNPREDVAMNRVLTASLPDYAPLLTLDEVMEIRDKDDSHSLYDSLLSYADENGVGIRKKCYDIVTTLTDLRKLSEKLSAEKLLRALAATDAFASICDTEAFTYLFSVAGKYSKTSWNGLYSFISYYKSLMEKGDSNSDPINAGDDEVTIITMHQSKGLEYPVCFLFGLGREFKIKKLKKPIIFNRTYGLSMTLPKKVDESAELYSRIYRKREENILWQLGYDLSFNRLFEEEARVLYVALTRAKERLYLSATVNKPFDDLRGKILNNGYVAESDFRGSRSFFDWLLLSVCDMGRRDELYELTLYQKGAIPPLADKISQSKSTSNVNDSEKRFATGLLSPRVMSDIEKKLSLIPAKVAASKVSPDMLEQSVFITTPLGDFFSEIEEKDRGENLPEGAKQILHRIELMKKHEASFDSLLEINKKPTAAERGSAAHRILQFCDYERVAKVGLDEEIETLLKNKFITERDAKIVLREPLKKFFESELLGLAKSAKKVHREFKFGLFRDATDFTEDEAIKKAAEGKKIFVQGSIDLILETDEGIILCDYKTDKIERSEAANRDELIKKMREKHGHQLEEYRYAVKKIFGKEPASICIYSIPLGEILPM